MFPVSLALGGRSRRVYLEVASFFDFDIAPGSAQVTAQITSGGVVNEQDSIGTTEKFTWLLNGAASAYEVMAELNSGTAPTGTLDTWLALSSSRSWITSQAGLGTTTCSLHISIRHAASGAVLAETDWSLTAEVSPP